MIPAEQASRRASVAEIWPPVSRVHDPGVVEVGEELLEGHGDHDGGAAAAGLRQLPGADGLDELGERDPVADRAREVGVDPDAAAGRVKRGEGEDHLAQHLSVPGRDPEPAVGGAFVVLPHRERGPARASASSASSALPSKRSARSGAITSKIRRPITRSALASCSAAHATRWASAWSALLGGDRELTGAGQPVQRGDDRAGLGGVDLPGRHPGREEVVVLELGGRA